MLARRLATNPILTPDSDPSIGANINGPSLLRVPDWVANPLGRYYLYFAHHQGQFIRLAYADDLAGPWRVYAPGVLPLSHAPCRHHLASPDVHLDPAARQFRMYFHGVTDHGQQTFLAVSRDGLAFEPTGAEPLGPFYFRVFEHEGAWYAVAKVGNEGGGLLRSPDGLTPFERGPDVIPRMRHAALRRLGPRRMEIYFSRGGDCPESILRTQMGLSGHWRTWTVGDFELVLAPEAPYEGADLPLEPSAWGAIHRPANQLRDPAIYEEDGRAWLVYSVAGESGLAMAEILE